MRILTVKNPWAYALAAGWKDVENRSWWTGHRTTDLSSAVAIHAGLDVDMDWESIYPAGAPRPPYTLALPRGAIIAVADLTDVVTDSTSPWAQEGQWHWTFANARTLTEPIPYTGGLGLRHLDDDVAAQVELALAEGTRS
jgi:hypothetical protein